MRRQPWLFRATASAALLLVPVVALSGVQSDALATTIRADDVVELAVRAASATMVINGSIDADSIRVSVVLSRCDDSRKNASRLETERDGNTLRLEVDQPGRDQCQEAWEITLPARMKLHGRVTGGGFEVAGLSGGLDLESVAGDVIAEVPRGPVRVRTTAGTIEVITHDGAHGDVDLETTAGHVEVEIGGTILRDSAGPVKIDIAGRGDDEVSLHATAGDVVFRVRPAGSRDRVGAA